MTDAVPNIAVAYNFFNGEEHLEASIRSIRPAVGHVICVAQHVSNAGQPLPTDVANLLHDLHERSLIDRLIFYRPDLRLPRRVNETKKRRLGLRLARRTGARFLLLMDADEFFRPNEITSAAWMMQAEGITSTSVGSFFHVVRPIYRGRDSTNVPFLVANNLLTRVGVKAYPVENVDPTRRMWTWPMRHVHMVPKDAAMYHMNFVRRDFTSKFANTSTTNVSFLEQVRAAIDSWKPGEPFHFPRKGQMAVDDVPNEFGTYDPGTANEQ